MIYCERCNGLTKESACVEVSGEYICPECFEGK